MREELLKGNCPLPKEVINRLILDEPDIQLENINYFWECLWYSYLNESSITTTVFADIFDNSGLFNSLLILLTKYNWINSLIENNYGSICMLDTNILKYISKEELKEVRYNYKLKKYSLRHDSNYVDNIATINGRLEKNGIIRKGFAKIYKNKFKYDIDMMEKHIYEIAKDILKGQSSSTKEVTYEEIVIELLAIINSEEEYYTTEKSFHDGRGRASFQCQKRVFNPISHKTARSLLVIPEETLYRNDIYMNKSIFCFIAELNGFKGIGSTFDEKANTGQNMYNNKVFSDGIDLHEKIWLERIYNKLDELKTRASIQWDIPIELDATASVVMMTGVLFNNHEYLRKTNVIGDKIEDIWTVEGIDRTKVKKFMTRQLYGSTISAKDTMVELKLEHTQEDLIKLARLLSSGVFNHAIQIKDYIINNAKYNDVTNVKIGDDEFFVRCNKFKWDTGINKVYKIYTSAQGLFKSINRNLKLVPDLKRFKRYAQTGLIHNIDSQIANNVCIEMNKWLIPNHDSFLINPKHAKKLKYLYAKNLFEIYKNRKEILNDYYDSLRIDKINLDKNTDEIEFTDINLDTILK